MELALFQRVPFEIEGFCGGRAGFVRMELRVGMVQNALIRIEIGGK
ncbi:MAG: hypothetical protein RL329_306 [Bacteroidota bacterium]|jgi:hypothetical protein